MTTSDPAISLFDFIASNNFVSEGNPNLTAITGKLIHNAKTQISPSRTRRHTLAAKKVASEHGALVGVAHVLEDTLARPCPGRGQAWRQSVRSVLDFAIKAVQAHARSAVSDSGLIAEVEVQVGRLEDVSEMVHLHKSLEKRASRLYAQLTQTGVPIRCREIRRRGYLIASALYDHGSLGVDLLQTIFNLDIGGEG